MDSEYIKHLQERTELGVLPLPLNPGQVEKLTELLLDPATEDKDGLVELLTERIAPGVDPAAGVKADFLAGIARGEVSCSCITPARAIDILATMLGGYNVIYLVEFLEDSILAPLAAAALKNTILIYDAFEQVKELMDEGNNYAREVVESWAAAEWFTAKDSFPELIKKRIYKIDGTVNNDDLSPPKYAATRADIPLHALTMGEDKFPDGIGTMEANRKEGVETAFVANTAGVGSSRKSAVNSLIWGIGSEIDYVPNKRRGGVVIAESIAPIFFNTFEDSGGLPIIADVSKLTTGMDIVINTTTGEILSTAGDVLSNFTLSPKTLPDEYRAGGRVPLIIGKKLTEKARHALGLGEENIFIRPDAVEAKVDQGYTLAQKIIGKACGKEGVLPAEVCEPSISAVASQDATGAMTRDELTELACLQFNAPLTLQSFCHTAAYPKEKDLILHKTLPEYFTSRGGVALKPKDGIIHSWFNRMLLPDQVATGGDSHVHTPLGISFPAGSGLVAFAAALGSITLNMPESILLKLAGELKAGITLRDLVSYIALVGKELSPEGKSIYNGKILEFEGYTRNLTVEQAFELSASAAERSAAGCCVDLDLDQVTDYLKSNSALIEKILAADYQDAAALRERLAEIKSWLAEPSLLRRDANAEYSSEISIELEKITEPVIATPGNPNNAVWLSEAAGVEVDEVFLGSCMTNIAHFRVAAKILENKKISCKTLWIVPPTRMDIEQLESEGVLDTLRATGARVEVAGCSLCMGNQARAEAGARVFSTSTKNTNNRMGDGAEVYLGSAELAAVVALLGRIPTKEEYFSFYSNDILPKYDSIYRYLDFTAAE